MTRRLSPGLIQVYTGDGKGKTTSALGLGLRALGRGFKVFMIQFLKGEETGEQYALRRLAPDFTFRQFGLAGFVRRGDFDPQDLAKVREAFALARQIIASGEYGLVILDEINVALHFEMLTVTEVQEVLRSRPPHVEVILTGRYAPPGIIARAALVTEMKKIKHCYNKGVPAREGIEF